MQHFLTSCSTPRSLNIIITISCTDLFVIEAGGEGEDSGAGVEREHVVGPVGDEGVADLAVGTGCVGVVGHDLADSTATRYVLQDVERVGGLLEARSVVVGVGDLEGEEIFGY